MKPVLLTASIAALIAVAACNQPDQNATDQSQGPDNATANAASGSVTPEQAYEIRHERYEEIGSRLGTRKVCKTVREWEEFRTGKSGGNGSQKSEKGSSN